MSASKGPLGECGGVEGRESGLGTVATFLSPRKLGGRWLSFGDVACVNASLFREDYIAPKSTPRDL